MTCACGLARRPVVLAALAASVLALGGCTEVVYRAAMPFLYREATLPETQIVRDVPYRADADADPVKHRLDLYRASGTGWPVLIFVHGGGWTSGDKNLRAGGVDVYANIGRFFATQGIGTAVVNYRLQPGVDWRAQVRDVADAVRWVHDHVAAWGGDPDVLFLAGHSAGAHLVAHVALDPTLVDVPTGSICGVVAVSGAAFDLTDRPSYVLGAPTRAYYEQRLRGGASDDAWVAAASTVRFARAGLPPTLVLYAGGEAASLKRQSDLFARALERAGCASRVVVVPGESHTRILLTLSRPDRTAAPAILDFIRVARCGHPPATAASVPSLKLAAEGREQSAGAARRDDDE